MHSLLLRLSALVTLSFLSTNVQAELVIHCPDPDTIHFKAPEKTPISIPKNWSFEPSEPFHPFKPPQAKLEISFVGGVFRGPNDESEPHDFVCQYAVKKPHRQGEGSFGLVYSKRTFIPEDCMPLSGEKNNTLTCP